MAVKSLERIAVTTEPRGLQLERRDRDRLLGYLFLTPACLLVFGLIVYPVIYDFALALTDATLAGPGEFVGLSNFGALLESSQFWIAARNSALYALLTSSARLVLGVAMALGLWQLRRGRALVFLALFIPWVFPATLSGFAFYWLMSPPFHTFYTMGSLAIRFALAGFIGEDLWHVGAIALHDVWRSSAFLAIFLLAGFNSIPTEQLDYALLECKSLWRRFWQVIFPATRRFIVLAMLLSLVISFIDYSSIYLQTGGRINWPLLGTLSYRWSFFLGETGRGSAITLIQLPFWLLVLWFGFRLFEREPRTPPIRESASAWSGPADWGRGVLSTGSGLARDRLVPPPAWRKLLSQVRPVLIGLAITVFAVFPIWWIFLQAIRPIEEDAIGNPFWTWAPTLDGFEDVLHGRLVGQWLLNTAILLGFGIALTLTTSILAGYALARLHVPGRRWIARALLATYFLPQPMVLIPIYQIFLWLHLDNTLLAVILLTQTLTIPFATWLLFSYFEGLPADIEEHASMDGSRWTVFRHIVLPMSWPVLIAAGIFAAGVMASDYVYAGLLLVHDQVKTIAVGLGLIGISLDEFNSITGGIGAAATPLVLVCALFAQAYVRGLTAAMVEGS